MAMKTLLLLLFMSLLSTPSWSETFDDLVKREGIYYQKFTDVPFTGKITGAEQGLLKNGKKEGVWTWYDKNSQLFMKHKLQTHNPQGVWRGSSSRMLGRPQYWW